MAFECLDDLVLDEIWTQCRHQPQAAILKECSGGMVSGTATLVKPSSPGGRLPRFQPVTGNDSNAFMHALRGCGERRTNDSVFYQRSGEVQPSMR